ncbi:Solute carrier family 35 member E3 [Porphyridium purpureum]|uniref:Solute carrier family 35 member E3 n=1 Tax=Porphyridium purpureum TaxID=35688 RepID=A0A5J4YQV8_PORPP|nr:Solute carrier family 35 member E3 [Porphyridium purpureum]|eukprot:POR8006..scf296_7
MGGLPGTPGTGVVAATAATVSIHDFQVGMCMALNFFSATGIVLANKYVMNKLGFGFATTLVFVHFFVTFALLCLCAMLGVFVPKKLAIAEVAKLAAGNSLFVVLTNLSLQYNSVGLYQIFKNLTTPTIVVIEAALYGIYQTYPILGSLVLMCSGAILVTSGELAGNLIGISYAAAGVVSASFYQVWSGQLQKSLDCNALQLQLYTAFISALMVLPMAPIFDNYSLSGSPDSIWSFDYSLFNVLCILGTGVLAFGVNVSIFLIIGLSSPIAYNVMGVAKTCVILASDFLFFERQVDAKSVTGMLVSMTGVGLYTYLKLSKSRSGAVAVSQDEDADGNNTSSSTSCSTSTVLITMAGGSLVLLIGTGLWFMYTANPGVHAPIRKLR